MSNLGERRGREGAQPKYRVPSLIQGRKRKSDTQEGKKEQREVREEE